MDDKKEYLERDIDWMAQVKSYRSGGVPVDKKDIHKFMDCSVFTYRRGLHQLAEALETHLRGNSKVTFRTNARVTSLSVSDDKLIELAYEKQDSTVQSRDSIQTPSRSTHDQVISALSPAHLSKLVTDSSLADALADIPAVTVMTVNLYYREPDMNPPGFGYLVPQATSMEQNPERALGVIFDNSYSAARSEANPEHHEGPVQDTVSQRGTKMTVMLGGHYWSDWPSFPSNDEGLEMAKNVLSRHLGIIEEPAAFVVNLQKDCIPQYIVGHEDTIKQIHRKLQQEYKGKLRVAGSWIRGVGVNDCLRSAFDVVQELHDDSKTGLESVVEEKRYVMEDRSASSESP